MQNEKNAVQGGTLKISDVSSWEGYAPSEFTLCGLDKDETPTYEYDHTALTLDAEKCTVIGKKIGVFTVKVTAGEQQAVFRVRHERVERGGNEAKKWDLAQHAEYVQALRETVRNEGDADTVLFVGDSFFDVRWFWTDFYRTYAGKNAAAAGSSGATSYDWEQYAHTFLKEANPKNLVVTVGTNNIFDDGEDAQTVCQSLQRMFQVMHAVLPTTMIYYFSIVCRETEEMTRDVIAPINAYMKNEFCAGKTWIKFVDITDEVGFAQLQDDRTHPLLATYDIYVRRLEEAGLHIPCRAR